MNLQAYDLLTDENINTEIVQHLRKIGFDVFDIKEENLIGISDREILQKSLVQNRVIVTQDSDFGTLIFTENISFVGIVYLRPGHFRSSFHIQTIDTIIKENIEVDQPFLVVAEKKELKINIRIRQFKS